jgi:putative ABC transport system permease protein
LERLAHDIKLALRGFRDSPVFTITAILALAVGIGANAAIFSVVDAVMLKPAPYPEPDSLVLFTHADDARPFEPVLSLTSPAKFAHLRAQTDVIEDVAAFRTLSLNLRDGDVLDRVAANQVTESYFRTFRARIERGRPFSSAEDAPGAPRTAVISHAFWTGRLGEDANVLGRALSLSGVPYTVVGVMAPDFGDRELGDVDLWVPYQLGPAPADAAELLQVAARLKPGVSLEQAQQRLAASTAAYDERFATDMLDRGITFSAIPFQSGAIAPQTRTALWVLSGTVGLVLLIACSNVASLMLARALTRSREIAIRSALGAGRGRIVRQLLIESALLSAAGCLLGVVLGVAGIRALLAVDTAGLPRVGADGSLLGMDWRVVAFTLGLSVVTSLLFGLVPALAASRTDLSSVIRQAGDRSGHGLRHGRLRSLLVVGEVGLAVVLLIGAALLIRTALALNRVDPGFTVDNVLVMRTSLSEPRFATSAGVQELAASTLAQIRAVPGVAAAAASCCVPLQRSFGDVFNVVGRDNGNRPVTGGGDISISAGGYLTTLEVPLLRGRLLDERDGADSQPVVVISRTMAQRYWPNGDDPLQSQIVIGANPAIRQVVGIVEDVRALRLTNVPRAIMYLPLAQIPDEQLAFTLGNEPLAWIVRTSVAPALLASRIQAVVRDATGAPVVDVQTMNEILSDSISRQRFNMLLMGVFAATALLLATVGIYGLVAFSVQQRTHEIGVRMALGARAAHVRAMVLRQGLSLTAIGLAAGLTAAFFLSRLLAAVLFGVEPRDATVFVAVPAVLALVAVAAIVIPAHRASRVDPLVALRHD